MTTEWPGYPAPTTPAPEPSSIGYVIAHEGCDGDLGGPLYQHTCGHVQMLAYWETLPHTMDPATMEPCEERPPTGARCANCGEQGHAPCDWRVLWRVRSPRDRGKG